MFKISSTPRFRREVTVVMPDGDATRTETFKATFELQPAEASSAADFATDAGQRTFLERAVVGIDDVVGEDGAAVPFGPELRSLAIGRLDVRLGLMRAYFDAVKELTPGN